MKRKTMFAIFLSLLIVLVLISVAVAQNVRPVNQDTYWHGTFPSDQTHGSDNFVAAEGGQASCDVTRAGLLKWDVSDIDDTTTVGNAIISLHTTSNSLQTDGTTLALFAAPDNWDETTTQGNLPTPPDPASTPLATVNGPFANGTDIVFQASGTGDPLIQYIQGEITGDNTVSFWVEFSSGCPGGGTALIAWNSREAGTSTMELSSPTSVSLSVLSANDSNTVNWPLIAGLFALAAVVVIGIGYGVRRSKQS